ncbi:MAG: HAD hydrolase-like protein [Bellilinea sp.]
MAELSTTHPAYQLVIFDFDGTLADSYPWFLSIFDELAIRFKLPRLEKSALEQLRKVDIHSISREFKIPIWKMVRIGSHVQKEMASQIENIRLVDGMQKVLDTLIESGIKLAVVSSNDEQNIRQVLGPRNAAHFEVFECGVSIFGKKAKFEKVLKATSTQPNQALCLGDEVRDLKSAQQAGIAFGAVTWGYTAAEMFHAHSPYAIFDQPEEILALF